MSDLRVVHLPAQLCAQAEKKFSGRFKTVDDLLQAVLEELLREDASRVDEAEQRIIEERLRELGYL